MNMQIRHSTATVRRVDLSDPTECAWVEAWLESQSQATPFHRPIWSEAVGRACRQDSHYLIAERAGALSGVLPVMEVRSPIFGNALVSSGFAVGGGILSDTAAIVDVLAEEAWGLAVDLGCPSLELRGGVFPVGEGWHRESGTYAGFIRPLAVDDDAELLAIPRKQRAEVRRSLTMELNVSIGNERADRDAHYVVYAESVRNLGTPVFPRALFAEVLNAFGSDADILTIRHQGKPVASVLSLYHQGVVMPYWGGGAAAARKLRANDLMYFALMRHARTRGCTHFDFGRSKYGTGAFAFKKNWGFNPTPLDYVVRTADGTAPRVVNPLDPRYRLQIALWRHLPLPIANRLGPLLSRGLG